ncbi:MAG: hypothetical protein IJY93_03655 [Clostridia bacterium]|nr:hypothetical protein [Clostridia bacterium]
MCAVKEKHLRTEIYILWLLILFLTGYFLKSPSLAAGSVKNALNVCAAGLIPSLFPFITLVNMITSSGLSDRISHILGGPLAYIFGIDRSSACAIILGSLGGFPIGAVCTRELYTSGRISKSSAERLISFTNNASPAFCIGTIGLAFFSDIGYGIRLYICQLVSAMLIGIIQRKPYREQENHTPTAGQIPPLSDIMTNAVSSAGMTMLKICSFAVFFAVIGDALCLVCSRFFGDITAALSASVCELTLAGRRCVLLEKSAARLICAFAVGWSGISVHMQCASVLSGSGIGMKRYYICKLFQGIICTLMMLIFI